MKSHHKILNSAMITDNFVVKRTNEKIHLNIENKVWESVASPLFLQVGPIENELVWNLLCRVIGN